MSRKFSSNIQFVFPFLYNKLDNEEHIVWVGKARETRYGTQNLGNGGRAQGEYQSYKICFSPIAINTHSIKSVAVSYSNNHYLMNPISFSHPNEDDEIEKKHPLNVRIHFLHHFFPH